MFPQRLTRSASLKLICELTGRGMQFGLAYTAQRLLGQVGYGQFSFAFSVGYVLAVFTDFGLQLIITREVAHGATHIARMGLLIKLALTGLALLALIAIATTRPIDQRGTFLLLGIALILNTFTEYFGYVLRGLQHITEEALLLLTQRALVAVSGVVLLWWRLDVMSLAVAYIVGAIATTSYAALRVRALLPTSQVDPLGGQCFGWLLSQSLPLGMAIVLSVAYTRTGPLLLDWLRGTAELGAYSVAQKLAEPMSLLPASIMAAVFPSLSWALTHDPAQAQSLQHRTLLILSVAGAFLALCIGLGSDALIKFLYRGQYADAIQPLQILGLAILPIFVNHALTHFTVAMGRQRLNLLFNGIIFGLNLALCLWWIPHYGATGAAASVLICECILFGLCSIALKSPQNSPKKQWTLRR